MAPQGGGKDNNFMHGMARPAGGLKLRHHSTDTSRRGHSASTTSVAAGGVAMRVQYKQGQTARER